jgi:hypothetical protein
VTHPPGRSSRFRTWVSVERLTAQPLNGAPWKIANPDRGMKDAGGRECMAGNVLWSMTKRMSDLTSPSARILRTTQTVGRAIPRTGSL